MLIRQIRILFLFLMLLSPSCSPTADSGGNTNNTTGSSESVSSQSNTSGTDALTEVEAIVKKMTDFYHQLDSLTADIEQDMQMKLNGQEESLSLSRSVAVQRPKKLAIYSTGEMPMLDIYQNDESISMSFQPLNKYSQEAPLESFDYLRANPLLSGPTLMNSMIFSLISDDPYEAIMDGVTEKKFVGLEELEGESVNHLRFGQDEFDWDAWIKADGDPLLLRVKVDMSKTLEQMAPGANADSQMTITETFQNWSINQPIDEEVFAFTPSADAEKVDNLLDEMMPPSESSSLLGKTAPPIELDLLNGGTFRLEEHVGQDIVMLDFWATWCGPCVEEIPLLSEIAEEYADKGVVFYAVNQGEGPDKIKDFLATEKLNLTVALDVNGTAGNDYQVQGLPTLALIDKEGVIQAVHVGYDPGIKKTLRREIDSLLNGKKLVKE